MARNLDKKPMADPENVQKAMEAKIANGNGPKHGITKFRTLDWTDEEQLTYFLMNHVNDEEQEKAKIYIRTLVEDESLDLTNFEIKRIATAMLALDRGDDWFFKKANDTGWEELSVELQKFLAGKESMVIDTLRKSKTTQRKAKSLWDQLDDPTLRNIEIKAEGTVEGVDYTFEAKKKKKPQMLKVIVENEDAEGNEDEKEDESASK